MNKIYYVFWDNENTLVHSNEVRKGVIEAINYFKRNNVKQAVIADGKRAEVIKTLDFHKLTERFEFVLSKEDYSALKPDPAPYQTALERMNKEQGELILPEHCLVIEDDLLGVQSAQAAGMTVLHRPIGDTSSIKELVS